MKKILVLAFIAFSLNASGQILVRNLQGDPIFSPLIGKNKRSTLLNLNTGTQSVGADYLFTSKARNPSNYSIYRFGISAKATEGVGPLITNGQFSPGVKITASKTKIRVFAKETVINSNGNKRKFDDWLTITGSINFEKNKLYNAGTPFKKQITDTAFKGYSLGLDYNMVLGVREQEYINLATTYYRQNNYSNLTSIDVIDKRSSYDSSTSTRRSIEKKVTAREGLYKEFDAIFIQLSYTHVPKCERPTDTAGNPNPNFKSLKFGYSIFYNALVKTNGKPEAKLGGSLFVISPNKDNKLVPRLALNLQINDLYDVKGVNNGIAKRIQAGLSATFSL